MSLVTVRCAPLSREQKLRIADRMVAALHEEGVLEASLQIRFEVEQADVWNSGLFIEAEAVLPTTAPAVTQPVAKAPAAAPAEGPLGPPRGKGDRERFKQRLVQALQNSGSLNSFEAQKVLGVEDCEWASGTIRGFFADLLAENLVTKVGLKRGTRYQWVGMVNVPKETPASAILVKPEADPAPEA